MGPIPTFWSLFLEYNLYKLTKCYKMSIWYSMTFMILLEALAGWKPLWKKRHLWHQQCLPTCSQRVSQFFVSIKDRGEHKRQAPMIQKAAYKRRETIAPVSFIHPAFLKSLFCSAVRLFHIIHRSLWPAKVRSRLSAGLQDASQWGCKVFFQLYYKFSETKSFSSRQANVFLHHNSPSLGHTIFYNFAVPIFPS